MSLRAFIVFIAVLLVMGVAYTVFVKWPYLEANPEAQADTPPNTSSDGGGG